MNLINLKNKAMTIFKKCKITMLPTNEKATVNSIVTRPSDNKMAIVNVLTINDPQECIHQNLYITSDDNIKKDDWVICSDYKNSYQKLGKVSHLGEPFNFKNTIQINGNPDLHVDRYILDYCKKIIATTDISLTVKAEQAGENVWFNPLPQPTQSFIEKYIEEYNKGNVITDVLVEYEKVFDKNPEFYGTGQENSFDYKLKVSKDNTVTIHKTKDSWTRDEVIEFAKKYGEQVQKFTGVDNDGLQCYCTLNKNKWIEENL